jgi:hypothetical protein
MLTAILTNGREEIPFFNHDERIFDLQMVPFGWTLIEIVKRNWKEPHNGR